MESSFEKLLVHLLDREIDFILVGGLAVAMNGYPRMTEDVDVWINPDERNIRNLISALGEFGEGHGGGLEVSDFSDEPGAIRVIEDFPLDLFLQMNGISFEQILEERRVRAFKGRELPYLSAEGLIRVKSGSMREKDQLDIHALKQIMERGVLP